MRLTASALIAAAAAACAPESDNTLEGDSSAVAPGPYASADAGGTITRIDGANSAGGMGPRDAGTDASMRGGAPGGPDSSVSGSTGDAGQTVADGGATQHADAGTADSGASDGGAGEGGVYQPCPTAAGTACVILPLGDSITEGFASSQAAGYRIELFRQAVQKSKNITFVGLRMNGPNTVENQTFPKRHSGYGGYTINGISDPPQGAMQGLAEQAIAMFHPHIVLLKIGTNDINGNMDVTNAPARLGRLIDKITNAAPSALLVVSSIIPTQNDGTNRVTQTYNTGIRGEANKRAMAGKHVLFLDNYALFTQNASYKTALMADNLHPNDQGYAVLGKSFYDAISMVLP